MNKFEQLKKRNDVLRFISNLSETDLVSLETHLIKENYEIDTKEQTEETPLLEQFSSSFESDLLTEDMQNKLKVIFEAEVLKKTEEQVARVIAEQEELVENYTTTIKEQLEEEYKQNFSELEENLDAYLDYVINEWSEENKLVIEEGVKTQISESVLQGLKRLFDDNYIDVPSDKISLIGSLEEKVNKLYTSNISLNEKNKELTETTVALKKRLIVEEFAKDLTLPQKEQLLTLSENIAPVKTSKEFKKQVEVLVSMIKEEGKAKPSTPLLAERQLGFGGMESKNLKSSSEMDPSVKRYLEVIEKM